MDKARDTLWIRETWSRDLGQYIYRADGIWDDNKSITWKPSIHMPRAASRITLEVKRVWVERVQDISEEDAIAEGVDEFSDGKQGLIYLFNGDSTREPLRAFEWPWDSINAKRGYGWDKNPWCWCVEFKVVKS